MRVWSIGLALGVALAAAGCRSPRLWADLHEPTSWRALASPPVEVATVGKTLRIVTDATPRNKQAAMFLAQVIAETCDRRPMVFVEREGQSCDFAEGLFVGAVKANAGWACPLAAENSEAFRVVAADGAVRFLGRADFAVYDWCERELGLRYYGEVGKCVERRAEIRARAVDYSARPDIAVRELRGGFWTRVAKVGNAHRGGVSVHQPHRWFADATLKSELPQIFESGETPMLCYGNPATLDYYKRRIDRHIAGLEESGGIVNTNRKVVTVCQWDAPIKCRCAWCRRLYDPKLGGRGEASPIIWGRFTRRLADWLAEAHPDYMVSFLPYLNTCEVPRRRVRGARRTPKTRPLRFEGGNAEAEVCTMPGLALMKDRACKRKEERIVRDWFRATGRKVYSWDYGCWPQEWTSAPYVFGRTIQAHYADMADELCGAFVCGGATDARLQLSMYVWLRCLWNPDVDVEAIYDGFARRMFGPAAKPMRELIALQEEGWNRQWDNRDCSYHNVFEVSYPRETLARMCALLVESERLGLAAGDELAVARTRWYASGLITFKEESDAIAAKGGRKVIRPGTTTEMVTARDVRHPATWAKTTVTSAVRGDELCLRVTCREPAAGKMDFTRAEDNFVWGHDRVTFAFADGDGARTAVVDLAGGVKDGWDGFAATVTHDSESWTVEARVRIAEADRAAGRVLGNVARWRVGDRRKPEAERVTGSRYEHSRLDTCYTMSDSDTAAFVEFRLAAGE